jgi:Lrp/AsnC family leucine-responsive transcriptional regulator
MRNLFASSMDTEATFSEINMMQSDQLTIDDIDRRLLAELQQDSSRPVGVIAELVGLSSSACYRRIQRLRESKLILREAAQVDQRRSAWPLTVIVELTMERLTEPLRAAFDAKVQRLPQIMQCYSASGDADFVMLVAMASMEDYHQFSREVLIADENIKSFKSTFTIRCLKARTRLEF